MIDKREPDDRQMSAEDMLRQAERYAERNPDLTAALIAASRVLSDHGIRTSARFLCEFVRWLRKFGESGMRELLECFEGLDVYGNDDYAIPNAVSAYYTRVIAKANRDYPGFKITVTPSKLDEVMP